MIDVDARGRREDVSLGIIDAFSIALRNPREHLMRQVLALDLVDSAPSKIANEGRAIPKRKPVSQ
jgi:hypothetical protein